MNKKGFTLIEIILAIAIMAILILILVPNIFIILNKNNEKSCNSLKSNIESAAKMYVINNKYDLGFSCYGSNSFKDIKNITLKTLVDSGYLKLDGTDNIMNPIDDSVVPLTATVTVTFDCSSKDFTYVINGIDCIK